MLTAAVVLCGLAFAGEAGSEPATAEPLTGPAVSTALQQSFGATWKNVGLRTIARRITETRGTAILLDRRLDPTRERTLTASGEPLLAFLEQLAHEAQGEVRQVGNTLYLGPHDATQKIRTLIQLRRQELAAGGTVGFSGRRAALLRAGTLQWDDLAQPAEILRRHAEERGLRVNGLELIPYDLWGGSSIPQTDAAEALSLILIQFDLTFEWIDRGEAIRIVAAPASAEIERKHLPPRGQTAAAVLAEWQQQFPELKARVVDNAILATGTIEQHEALERPGRPARPDPRETPVRLKPLRQERYTLRIKETPVRALLQKLSEPAYGQLKFEYDPDTLKESGIDLEQRVTFEVKNATIEQLLEAALRPLRVEFKLVDRTAHLKPRQK